METSSFYHSFPRKHPNDIGHGLSVLHSILKSGLLLTPEVISWREPGRPRDQAPKISVLQTRICFTELLPRQLAEHSTLFGRFALEFSVESLRELGAIPVFYVPNSAELVKGLDGAGQALVMRVAQIQTLLERFRQMKNQSPAKEVLVSASEGLLSLEELCFSLVALQNLLAPTENLDHTKPLFYYRQREWRIIENFAVNGHWPIRKPSDQEREALLATDGFFQKELKFEPARINQVIDGCRFFSDLGGTSVIQRVRRILVPSEALSDASQVVQKAGFAIPVEAQP
jgi:hypothetical protein